MAGRRAAGLRGPQSGRLSTPTQGLIWLPPGARPPPAAVPLPRSGASRRLFWRPLGACLLPGASWRAESWWRRHAAHRRPAACCRRYPRAARLASRHAALFLQVKAGLLHLPPMQEAELPLPGRHIFGNMGIRTSQRCCTDALRPGAACPRPILCMACVLKNAQQLPATLRPQAKVVKVNSVT